MIGIGIGINRLRGGAFSPASLFAAGEQGGWFDYSDAANLDWRRNLLTYTEDFSNAAWVKGGATVIADKLVENTASATTHSIAQAYIAPSGTEVVFSIDLKAGERSWVRLTVNTASGANASAYFDISSGVVGSIAGGSASIESVGDGWYRCAVSGVLSTANPSCSALLATADGGQTYTGDGVSGAYARSPQLEVGSTATDYQKITDVVAETRALFPKATLYQDTAGTTPVTTPGQTVALALDKSQGLVLGPELATNGAIGVIGTATAATYNTTTGEGSVSRVDLTNQSYVEFASLAASSTHKIILTCNSGTLLLRTGVYSGTVFAQLTAGQTATVYGLSAGSGQITLTNTTSVGTATFTVSSVRELPGNHAIQGTALQRPTYGVHPVTGIRNRLTYTEDFSNAAWTKGADVATLSVDAIGPDGEASAVTLADNGSGGTGTNLNIQRSVTVATSTSYTISVFAKAGGIDWLNLTIAAFTTPGTSRAYFDLANGAVGTVDVGFSSSAMEDFGNGWYRCSVTFTTDVSDTLGQIYIAAASDNGNVSIVRDGASSILIYGAQLELGSTATAYQRVTSQFDVSEAGVAQIGYLSFDGVDDGMVTPTITPGTDKAQVFAGVRKLSGAADGVILETSVTGTSPGQIAIFAPSVFFGDVYTFVSRGTVRAQAVSSAIPSPTTNVITGIGDISGDRATLRVDGVQVAQDTADQGTGNFLAYPLYIGRRGGTTLPFNGRIYQLIVRFGPNLTDAQIAATESYIAGKTGVEL
jgi:hypothetical protein